MKPEIFLKSIDLFDSLSFDDTKRLAALLRRRSLKKGEVLFRKGDEGNALYLVRKGSIMIVLPSVMGDEVSPAIFTAGDFFGEMALLDGMPRSADAVALEQTEILALNRKDFLAFLQNNEKAIQAILSYLSIRLRKTDDLLEDAHFLTISTRLARRLVELAKKFGHKGHDETIEINLNLNQSDLASVVGTTRESINKELRVLREKDIVQMVGSTIIIRNMDRLGRRARI
jgi:CRP-like cAMP-binding protein